MGRRLSLLALAVALLVPRLATAEFPQPVGMVNDFARILSPEVSHQLESDLIAYKNATSIEIAVVTVSSLEGMDVADYTNQLFRKWGVGDKAKSNGILVLSAPTERKSRIEVGYGLEGDLPDAKCSRILREVMSPYHQRDDRAGGLVAGVAAIKQALGDTPFAERKHEAKASDDGIPGWLLLLLIIMAIVLIFLLIIAVGGGGNSWSGGSNSGGIFSDSSGGGGGFGGFGGGDSGGGGASGD